MGQTDNLQGLQEVSIKRGEGGERTNVQNSERYKNDAHSLSRDGTQKKKKSRGEISEG